MCQYVSGSPSIRPAVPAPTTVAKVAPYTKRPKSNGSDRPNRARSGAGTVMSINCGIPVGRRLSRLLRQDKNRHTKRRRQPRSGAQIELEDACENAVEQRGIQLVLA